MSDSSEQWGPLVRDRPRLGQFIDGSHLIGHTEVRTELVKRLELPGPIELFLVAGGKGSGKSAIARWLASAAPDRTVLADEKDRRGLRLLDPEGRDIERLVSGLRARVAAIGPTAVLVYDDAHADLRPGGMAKFVRQVAQDFDLRMLVVLTATSITADFAPIPTTTTTLDRREADFDDFDAWLGQMLRAVGTKESAFSEAVRHSLHELSEQTSNFAAVEFLIEMLVAYHLDTHQEVRVDSLYRLLVDHDGHNEFRRHLPAVRRTDDRWMTFRRKDKTELLAELLLRHMSDPVEMAEVAGSAFPDFDRRAFLDDARHSFRDAVTVQCLTRSPVELVNGLLDRTIVRREIQELDLDPNELFRDSADRTDLLLRGLGFSVAGDPEGLPTYAKAVDRAAAVAEDAIAKIGDLKGFQKVVAEKVEEVMRDLVDFWATHLFGSVSSLIDEVRRESGRRLVLSRLQMGDLAALMRYMNTASRRDDLAFKLSFIDVHQPFSVELLRAVDEFIPMRNEFVHGPFSDDPEELRLQLRTFAGSARRVIAAAGDGIFPGVIKLSEIVFDEYGRRIFIGVDSEGEPVRFALTDDGHEELVVARHYYMMPQRRVSVNPLIVPVAGGGSVLFDDAEGYDAAATTQLRQGQTLLDRTTFRPGDLIIDIGCGTGQLTLEIAARVPTGSVVGMDKSPEMIGKAEQRLCESGLNNVSFLVADLLNFTTDDRYDLVISNSSMHWILPPEAAYEKLFLLLRPQGRLAVHQGGRGCYRGLWRLAWKVVDILNLRNHYYHNFDYPAYYPEQFELKSLLSQIGFVNVEVRPEESDGREYPDLVRSFSQAGLLPFLAPLPTAYQEAFRKTFIRRASVEPPDLYTHRLYATAVRP